MSRTPLETIAAINAALDDWEKGPDAAQWNPDVADPQPALLVHLYAHRYGLETSEVCRRLAHVRDHGQDSEYFSEGHAVDALAQLGEAFTEVREQMVRAWEKFQVALSPLVHWGGHTGRAGTDSGVGP